MWTSWKAIGAAGCPTSRCTDRDVILAVRLSLVTIFGVLPNLRTFLLMRRTTEEHLCKTYCLSIISILIISVTVNSTSHWSTPLGFLNIMKQADSFLPGLSIYERTLPIN